MTPIKEKAERTPRVCLIVDNPLRDLDGLVLLAYQLALHGVEAVLVPMYEQLFDVPALKPDLVLVNYVRGNNQDAVRFYQRHGIRVGVLDTEGAGGKSAEEFAQLVKTTLADTQVNLYCVWGETQYQAFKAQRVVPESVLRLTGCPRYDYCAQPWTNALPNVPATGYVLINTNFPTVNPKFSRGAQQEHAAMVQAGFQAEFAQRFIEAGHQAQADITALVRRLTQCLPDVRFVLRPHPFESLGPYRPLEASGNLQVIQTGTSLQWLSGCAALLHMNCSTAIEAVMLGREPISPSWLNHAALHVPMAQCVSKEVQDEDTLAAVLLDAVSGKKMSPTPEVLAARQKVLRDVYYRMDGEAAKRVAQAIVEVIGQPVPARAKTTISMRAQLLSAARAGLGYWGFHWLKNSVLRRTRSPEAARAKGFSVSEVNALLVRLAQASGLDRVQATVAKRQRRQSGHAIRVVPNISDNMKAAP